MSIEHYTEHQLTALEMLAQYRFLTAQQFAQLGVAASADATRKNVLSPLARRNKNPIAWQDVGRHMGASHIWHLTAKGAKDLADYWEVPADQIPYPIGGVKFSTQYFHRIAQIDFHIGLRQWAQEIGANVAVSDMDFVMEGAQRKGGQTSMAKVTLKDGSFIIPDALFGFSHDENPFLYALEVHHKTSTQKITAKLKGYFKALMEGAISNKYNYQRDCYVLNVFEPDRLQHENKQGRDVAFQKADERAKNKMKYVCERLMTDGYFPAFKPVFFFNTMTNVRADITQGWQYADGTPAAPFG